MYTTVADRLVVTQDEAPEYSQPVSMEGGNAVMVDCVVFNKQIAASKKFELELEGSNDLQNWTAVDSANNVEILAADNPGYFTAATLHIDDIPTPHVRLKYKTDSTTSGDYIIVNAGINVFHE